MAIASNQTDPTKPALARVMAISAVAMLVIGTFFLMVLKTRSHTLELRTYFKNAEGLRAGAPIRLSGVEVGKVTSIRVRPERREAAAEVLMHINTPYSLQVPKDAVAELETAGILGETLININLSRASGAPANNGDELRAQEKEMTKPGEFEFYLGNRRKDPDCPPPSRPQKSSSDR